MQTLFDNLSKFSGTASDFKDHLERMQLLGIFGDLYAAYPDPLETRKIILYILYVFALDSPLHLERDTLRSVKQRAAEHVRLSEMLAREIVDYEFTFTTKATHRKASKAGGPQEVDAIPEEDGIEKVEADTYRVDKVITAIENFIRFQNEPIHSHLLRKKDLYDQISSASHRMLKKNSAGDVDWRLKIELNEQADKVLEEIQNWEAKLIMRNAPVREAMEDVQKAKRTIHATVRPETAIP